MTRPRDPSPPTTLATALAALSLAGVLCAAGCWNGAGVTCPPGEPSCGNGDLSVAVDAAVDLFTVADLLAPDLSRPDLSHPDLAMCAAACKTGCCDPRNVCHDPATADFCGTNGRLCMACDALLADGCVDGGCACGKSPPCDKGQRCLGGTCVCDEKSCPTGCCGARAQCLVPDVKNCGFAGSACLACDNARADGCLPNVQPMPVVPPCSCGMGPACPVGEVCKAGTCLCDQNSCGGCCDKQSGRCLAAAWPAACGGKGSACTTCDKLLTDGCNANGGCGCGAGPPCAVGQHCVNKTCVCNAASCPTGCCAGARCNFMPDRTQCGIKGSACVLCGDGADTCVAGACQCGGGAACAPGQRCNNGGCKCDAILCATGCCDNNGECRFDANACGLLGGKCTQCGNGALCVGGVCSPVMNGCGNQALCLSDKKCYDRTKCSQCVAAGRPAALCTNLCVASCGDCVGANKTCSDGMGSLSCVANCNNCPGPCI